ncbi:MAG TPA: SRPBCC family protein [Candidatus Elarobacter sp.]|nr:SRPBCC family protein [Candidatus Elarobacter sp.]
MATNTLEVTTPSDREIVMKRVFDAPHSSVFDAFTKPDLIKRWLLGPDGWSMPVCDVDLNVGGTYHYVWRNDVDASEFGFHGRYREIVRPERIVHVESMDGQPGEALITTTFVEQNGSTTVTTTMQHESRAVRDMVLATGMDEGVARSYERLDEVLG